MRRILHSPPQKLWRGKKRLCKFYYRRNRIEMFQWACSIRPGDYIGTCEGFNRKVVKIEYVWHNEGWWKRCKPNRNWFLQEIRFYDTKGGLHHFPGCVEKAESVQEILDYYARCWSKVSPPKLDEHGEIAFTEEEYRAWREEFSREYKW